VGTADYVAPEQAMGERIDGRADIYSLGCVLFEALTGRVLFPEGSETAKAVAHVTKDPPTLLDLGDRLPKRLAPVAAQLQPILARALAKKPEDRYPTAGEFAAALQVAIQRAPTTPGTEVVKRSWWRPVIERAGRRVLIPVGLLAIVGVIAAILAVGGVFSSNGDTEVAEPRPELPPAAEPPAGDSGPPAAEPVEAPAPPSVPPAEPPPSPPPPAPPAEAPPVAETPPVQPAETGVAGSGGGSGPAPEARIVVASDGDLFAVALDTGQKTRLTRGAANDQAPECSPDGETVWFARDGDVWSMHWDGTDLLEGTTTGAKENAPSLSSAGTTLAFDTGSDIWRAQLSGREVTSERNLTGAGSGAQPDWSPDGGSLVYQSQGSIWIMNGDGSGQRNITSALDGTKLNPAWSPRGTTIAFQWSAPGGGSPRIYVLDLNTGRVSDVTQGEAPVWSPDGTRLAFVSGGSIWSISPSGANKQRIAAANGPQSLSWCKAPG
jgi:Tol biopolymer transport system component